MFSKCYEVRHMKYLLLILFLIATPAYANEIDYENTPVPEIIKQEQAGELMSQAGALNEPLEPMYQPAGGVLSHSEASNANKSCEVVRDSVTSPLYQPFKSESELRSFIYDSGFSKNYVTNSCAQTALDFMYYARSKGYDVWIYYVDNYQGRDHVINMTKAGSSYYSFDVRYRYGMLKNLGWWGVK